MTNILVTGGTGTFGKAFITKCIADENVKRVVVFSRDDMKQWAMKNEFHGNPKLRFFLGDVRDRERLYRAFEGIDIVIHAAASKIVPTAEYDPFECTKTNVLGAMNVVDAAIDKGVKKVLALSTDKASSPTNLYGATKLVSDRIFVASNSYTGSNGCAFSVVRYGNVIGSRGSIIPYFLSLSENEYLPITHPEMTRFVISIEEAVEFVEQNLRRMVGGEIFIPKLPSLKIVDLAKAISPNKPHKIIGLRLGEKIHEEMISAQETSPIYEDATSYLMLGQQFAELPAQQKLTSQYRRCPTGTFYSSDKNDEKLNEKQIKALVGRFLDKNVA